MTAIRTAAEFRAWATIDLQALNSNLALARSKNPDCSVVAVVKANGYGHGAVPVSKSLRSQLRDGDCFGVATIEEALELRRAGITEQILLLEGFVTADELEVVAAHGFQCVLHSLYQLESLLKICSGGVSPEPLVIWLKVDTGMHRLGLGPEEFAIAWSALHGHAAIRKLVVMSHFACADDATSPATGRQVAVLQKTLHDTNIDIAKMEISLAASAAILIWPQTHYQWLRPGIMLYGGAAVIGENGVDRGLRPVMTLRSRLIAVKTVAAGEAVGYGASYICDKELRIGIVSIGYGDGYPRRAPAGTPVLINSRRDGNIIQQRAGLAGRVSMDMIIVDLAGCEHAAIGDEVILWGQGLPADEIARHCDTISYELFCQVTPRVHYLYE
ncbi:MAG: alanine racemase [Gammaproteobacteria bacterium]|nr:alanine racemase [Gammaproteobacteria bacterium]MDP2142069.1 alanine racemase [Gammaproteobacteria bacterium]MDP2348352.1 alanine racemase [Gammaproteobacteria bacterium]